MGLSLLYNLLIALGALLFIPYTWFQSWLTGKGYPSLFDRLGFDIPDSGGRETIWVHAVSVGEARASVGTVKKLRRENPDAFIFITTASATGLNEAKKMLLEANSFRFLPLDFSWIMKRWARKLKPKLLLFIEGDVWYHLARAVKSEGGRIVLLSGRMSERSARRWSLFKPLARKLFNLFDEIHVQNEECKKRFEPLITTVAVQVSGNLKFQAKPQPVDLMALRAAWGAGPWITIASTHEGEEELILDALKPLFSQLRIFLAPRHPERSEAVADLLRAKAIPYCRIDQPNRQERFVLVDRIGELAKCYSLSFASIVGGSFVSSVGGHNVLEPTLYGCRSFFGPYTHHQKDLVQHVLESKKGEQINLDQLVDRLRNQLSVKRRL